MSVVKNVLYKVIRARNADELGEHIVVQGGTFLNKVCVDKVDDGGILAEACQPECCIRQWPNLP